MVVLWHIDEDQLSTSRKRSSVLRYIKKPKNGINSKDKNGWAPLHYAANVGNDKFVKLLLENGADVNRVSENGFTPLHISSIRSNAKCIEIILYYKPKMNIKGHGVNTPLNMFIRWSPHGEVIMRKFLEAGADPNALDEDEFTSLHYVARRSVSKKQEIYARLLIEYNANVNSKSKNGTTPLHSAIISGSEDVVRVLLENGAYINTKDSSGVTEMELALSDQTRNPNILKLLGRHLIIQNSCKMQVNLEHLKKLCEIQCFKAFENECEGELLELKREKIGKSALTYYDILILHPHKISKYLRNSEVLESLKDFESAKYILGKRLVRNFHEGLRRYEAFKIGDEFCRKVFPLIPDICIDKIIEYISNEDLNNLKQLTSC